MILSRLLPALACLLTLALPAAADPMAKDVFGRVAGPTAGRAAVVGTYNKGCISGAVALPESGPTWQAMRLSRDRNWGHPMLVDYVVGLSRAAAQIGYGRGLYVGDISQARGGPMMTGHASHQLGLDVDIWMLPPARLDLSRQTREQLGSVSVVNRAGTGLSANFTPAHARLLQTAAMDDRVDRIFTDHAVKAALCAMHGDRGAWLQRIRFAPAHDHHFHVRLKCPAGDPCTNAATPVAQLSGRDNGCGEARAEIEKRRNPPPVVKRPKDPDAPVRRHPRSYRLSELPRQCQAIALAR